MIFYILRFTSPKGLIYVGYGKNKLVKKNPKLNVNLCKCSVSHADVEKLSEEALKNFRQPTVFCREILRCKSSIRIEKNVLEHAEWLNKDVVLLPEVLVNATEDLSITLSVVRPQTFFEQSSE